MKKITTALFLGTCLAMSANVPYRVTVPVHEEAPGTMIYLVDYDTSTPVDSAKVVSEQVVFTGEVDNPWVGRIVTADSKICTFIVEEGSVSINRENRCASGMMYNDMLNAYNIEERALSEKFASAASEQEQMNILSQYMDFAKKTAAENADNPVGYLAFIDVSSVMEPDEMLAFLAENPELKGYARVRKLEEGALRQAETSEGKPFVDFEVTYDGKTERLSDYVGKGQYTLVDFWASWCGPCMREMPVIKEIYDKYADKGLQVLGVAVWDEPENSLRTMEAKKLPWHSMVNAQSVPTDAYGIAGIPCIILFGPDGTIVSRGARGEGLKAVVAKAMEK